MRHTDQQIERASDRFEQLADALEPMNAEVDSTDDLREIASTSEAVRSNETRLRETVEVARARGRSWNQIALALGVSRQAARQRYTTKSKAGSLRTETMVSAAPSPEDAERGILMPEKKNVHTVPTEDGWANRREGGKRASSTHDTKAEAQAAGREAAKKDGVEHLIHKKDGTIGDRNSYGNDPHPPKG